MKMGSAGCWCRCCCLLDPGDRQVCFEVPAGGWDTEWVLSTSTCHMAGGVVVVGCCCLSGLDACASHHAADAASQLRERSNSQLTGSVMYGSFCRLELSCIAVVRMRPSDRPLLLLRQRMAPATAAAAASFTTSSKLIDHVVDELWLCQEC